MSSPTRWAGVPLTDRRAERALLVDAGYRLFGEEGEAGVSVRSVCRECGLNTRYFYESFDDVDDLLGAVYDRVSRDRRRSRPRSRRLTTQCGRARGPASPRCSASARPTRAAGAYCSPRPARTLCWRLVARRPRNCCARACLPKADGSRTGSRSVGRCRRRGHLQAHGQARPAVAWRVVLGDDLDAVVDHALARFPELGRRRQRARAKFSVSASMMGRHTGSGRS